ncbi:hypothetical protein F4780DRAFT_787902 [Xylariomycetidae sp. FL0641]|nr:hypothetical protein F4780DRAFT_787902 [Xylariomycetidae sp. FL0641]
MDPPPHRPRLVAIARGPRVPATTTHPSSSSSSAQDDDARWQQVLAHARGAAFVYGAVTTRIYCRPSCAARRPRRANCRFFDAAPQARAAGYRACRRCTPDDDGDGPGPELAAACAYIAARRGAVEVADVAARVGLSACHLHALFRANLGETPAAFAAEVRSACDREEGRPPPPPPHAGGEATAAGGSDGLSTLVEDLSGLDGSLSDLLADDSDLVFPDIVPGPFDHDELDFPRGAVEDSGAPGFLWQQLLRNMSSSSELADPGLLRTGHALDSEETLWTSEY